MNTEDIKIKLVDFSEINSRLSEYVGQPFKFTVDSCYSGFLQNTSGDYALISEDLDIYKADLSQADVLEMKEDHGDDLEVNPEFEVMLNKEGESKSKFKFTIPLITLLEAPGSTVNFNDYVVPGLREVEAEKMQKFDEWYQE